MPGENLTNINFQPLNKLKRANVVSSAYWVLGYFIFVTFVLSTVIAKSAEFSMGLLLVGTGLIVKFYLSNKHALENNQKVLAEFAAVNNMNFVPIVGDGLNDAPGTLFTHGHSMKGSNALTGRFGEWPLSIFRYDYATGSGKSRRSYDATVVEVELPRNMPHMVIDSLVEEGVGYGSVLPIEFDKSQKIDLEGDFYKYFALYAPDKYGISALTVIAPDTMQVLIEHAALCDIEIIDNKLYFYWPEVAATRQQYEQVFGTVEAVLKEIGNKLSRDDIFATVAQAQVHSVPNAQGVRLKKQGLKLATILFAVFYICSQIISEMNDPPPILLAAFAAVFLIIIANVLHRHMARKRLLTDLQQRYQNYRQV